LIFLLSPTHKKMFKCVAKTSRGKPCTKTVPIEGEKCFNHGGKTKDELFKDNKDWKKCSLCRKYFPLEEYEIGERDKVPYSTCKKCTKKNLGDHWKRKENIEGRCLDCHAETGIYKKATCGYSSDCILLKCEAHKQPGMELLLAKDKQCIGCVEEKVENPTQATFGYPKGSAIVCKKHIKRGMVDIANRSKKCDCGKYAVYGFEKATKCEEHKEAGMRLLARDACLKCKEAGIFKYANYGFDKKIACLKHKEPGMEDIANRWKWCPKCKEAGIFKQSFFGFPETGKIAFCSAHKEPGMEDLYSKTYFCVICFSAKKEKVARFGFLGELPTSCCQHAEEGMVNLTLKSRICEGCLQLGKWVNGTYGFQGKKGLWCKKHRRRGMILKTSRYKCLDCSLEGKKTKAKFGPLFGRKIHCDSHKIEGELEHNNPTCEKCESQPFFAPENSPIPIRCEEHREETDLDMVRRECVNCLKKVFIQENQEECLKCRGLNEDGFQGKNPFLKSKEDRFALHLESLSNEIGLPVRDKRIRGGKTQLRPDFYYKNFRENLDLIIELDECQHVCRTPLEEVSRMVRILEDIRVARKLRNSSSTSTSKSNKEKSTSSSVSKSDEEKSSSSSLLFLRFNPDYYLAENFVSYSDRVEYLKKFLLEFELENSLPRLGVIYMYYDGVGENSEIKEIKVLKREKMENFSKVKVRHKHPFSEKKEFTVIIGEEEEMEES